MLKCKRGKGQIVLPIFYNMEPFQVRHLMGRLGDAINAHKVNMDEMVVKEWEEALKEVSYLNGWELEKIDNRYEGALIKIVVEKVMSELKGTFQLVVPKDSVGIDDHVQHIMSFIDTKFDDTRIIGIYGMGGIGKTTLARVLYNKLSSHFKYLSFVPNIRERSHRKGIECLQKQLISDILGSPYDVSNVDEGIGVLKSRFTSKKILVLLDDVENYTHLIALVGDGSWFKAGSRVIITTRDKSILDMDSVRYKYQLNELLIDQSLFLFSRHAFQKDSPPSDYKVISLNVISTTGGLPLALEVIGSFLHGKSKEVWKDTLKKLERAPAGSVHEKLRIIYDALIFEEQQIFLDIACFFVGSSKQSPIYMWESCGFFPERGITTLSHMSLIKIDEYGKLMMHDQIRDFGREIARLENLKKPQKRSRLWINEEAMDVLDSNKGTKKIEALCLDNYGRKSYTNEHFENLTNLRFLQVDGANFIGDFKYLLPQLRWLHWQACPSDFAAVNFHLKELVVLNLSRSEISEDWGGWGPLKMATKLKVLNLSHCLSLRSTPDLSAFKSLEVFILEECLDLKEIHPSIGDIKTLISLNVRSCQGLEELPAGVGRMEELRELLLDHTNIREIPISRGGLMKLETVRASFCEELAQLPDSIGSLMSLTQLDLSHSGIEELPASIGSLNELKTLHASYCASLAHIPSSMGNLTSLCLLDLTECDKLAQLPDSIGSLVSLQRLLLRGCHSLREIPDSIGKLASLAELDLKFTAIAKLPESIRNLQNLRILDIHGTHMTKLPGAIGMLAEVQEWNASCCENLEGLPSNIGKLVSLSKPSLDKLGISRIPESIFKTSSLQMLDISEHMFAGQSLDLSSSKYLRELCVSNSKNLTEIRGLDGLEDLQVLDIFGCTSLRHSPDLSNLKNLKSLYAENCENLVEFQGLHGLESLINLAISGCTSLIQLDLSNLKNLKNFNAACCGNLVEIRGFHGLESLRDLKISGCTSLRRSPQLSTLKNLENFYAANCENLDEIEGLDGLEFLSNLDISGCTFLRQSLDLSNLKRLKKICAASCENLVKIRGLYGSESLINLYIAGCTSLRRLDLSNLKNLNNFCAANCENLVEIRGLHGSESLRYLDISGCKSLRQLLDLSNLKNLENFSAANCENLTEIRGLDGSESLRDLDISGWKSLRISPDLSNLKYLENFYVANCENLVEIQGLGRSKSLRDLDISGCVSLRGMDLSNLKNLENLYAANCDHLVVIEGLDRLESLRDLDISGCTSLRRSLDLSNSKNLENFYAANCKNLDEIRGLDGLEFLRDLDISGCTSLKQSLDLSNLKHLWRFCAANCENLIEIQVLDGLEFLRELDISGCTSLRQSLHLSNASLETKPLKMQREVSGPSILLPRESTEKMKDKAVQQAVDLETSDRNYAIAAAQNLVGIDDRVKQITGLLEMEVNDGVHIIGIYGTDGIGKTTLAKAVYDQISSCFDSCSFLAEVEETTQNSGGIQFLQAKLVRDILKPDREDSSFDETIELFLDIFREMKVLIIVDDVEKQSHLHAIVGDRLHWFGEGSRIIVTSENEEILKEFDSGKASTYMVSPLDNGQAVELFRQHAFKMQSSWPDYDEFANLIVSATVKLPLAVEVIGSFLRGKSIEEWEKMDKSMKLFTMTSQKTTVGFEEILDICYKELDQQQKDIFLDIACFISGVDIRIASYMWPNSYLPSSDCILMPLAKIGENNELQMHRLLRCFGKRILNQEGSGDPIQRKFYILDMVPKAISREKEDVEALCFDLDDHASCIFTPGDFESMPDIRFLKLDSAKLSGNFAGAFPSLRWLCWQRCPLDFDAINLVLRELVILDLSGSKVTEDWGGWSETKMEKLKVLNLTRCSDLLITPNFSNYKDLEILILERCSHLVKLDPSIGHLKRLVSLNMKFCSQLNGLPVELGGMTSLKELFIDGTSVWEIPISIGNLKQLEILSGFKCFPLTYLPSSISYLTALSRLSLDGAKLTVLPSSLGELLNLRRLSLRDCRYMEELPDSIGKMGSLEELDISATSISMLPNSRRNLQSLRVLRMDSSFIGAFPGEIGDLTKLKELHASRCRSLKGAIPGVIKELHHLRSLTLGHSSISSLPSEISTISGLLTLDLLQCNEIEELPKLPPSLICLRVSSKRMKAIPLLEDLKELEELCLSDGNLKSRRPPSKQPMPEFYVKQMIDKPSFSISFPKLRKLELSLSQIYKLKFEPTADIAHLEMLNLPGLSHKEVSELPKTLSVFELYHSAVEEIEGLEGLEALKRLDISNCKIQNLNGIGQLTSLRSLILSDCGDLNLPDLSNLKLLKVLEIRRCKMICQIEGLEKLTSLEKLNISECPAESLVQVRNAMKHVMARSPVM